MKNILLLFILFFNIGFFADEAKAQTPEFGIRAGINLASFNSSKQEVDSRRIGLLAGVYTVVPISGSSFSIQPEVLYTQKGATINNVDVKLSYIQVPVFARVDFASESFLSPHLILGPYVSFNLKASAGPNPIERAKSVIYGMAIGAGVDVSRISIGIRYSYGFAQVYQGEEPQNTAISIVAGFRF